jgi:hypothetical protein
MLTWEAGRPGARPAFVVPALVAGLLLSVGVLSGCQGSDGQDPGPSGTATPSPSVSASPTATPTPAPPKAPAPKRTARGAEAFVRYFWEVHNDAYQRMDSGLFRSLIGKGCKFCTATADEIDRLALVGTKVEGSSVSLATAGAPPGRLRESVVIVTVIAQTPGKAIKRDGSMAALPGVRNMRSSVRLDWSDGKWLVGAVVNDKKTGTPWAAP